jgi:hypothetical protein
MQRGWGVTNDASPRNLQEVAKGDTLAYIGSPDSRQGIDAMSNTRQKAGPNGNASQQPTEGGTGMKIAPWYLAALAPFAAIGYSGAHLGHAFVVLLTVGIFLGTLSLRRAQPKALPSTRE